MAQYKFMGAQYPFNKGTTMQVPLLRGGLRIDFLVISSRRKSTSTMLKYHENVYWAGFKRCR